MRCLEKQEQEKIINQSIKIMFKTWYKNIGFLTRWGYIDSKGTHSTILKTSLRKKIKEGKHLLWVVVQVHRIPWQWLNDVKGGHVPWGGLWLCSSVLGMQTTCLTSDFSSTHTLFQLTYISSGTEKEVHEAPVPPKILASLSILALQLVSYLLHRFWCLGTHPTDLGFWRFWRY